MNDKLPSDFLWILLAVFGGFAKYLNAYLTGKEIFSLPRLLATIIACGFAGYMSAQFALLFYPSWALFSAGIGGYIGVEIINSIYNQWAKKFGIKNDKD